MDPQLKQIIDELKLVASSVGDLKSSLTQRISDVEKTLGDRFQSLEKAAQLLDDWKPKIDSSMEDLRIEVGALRKTVNRVVLDMPTPAASGILPKPVSAAASPPASKPIDNPSGHRHDSTHRETVFGSVYTHTHLPVTGMAPSNDPKFQ